MAQTIGGIDYLDGGEAAELLGVKKATLYAYVSRGLLRSYKQGVGRNRLYRRTDIERLLSVRPSAEAPLGSERVRHDVDLPDAESWASEH
jgi:citrate synthase